MTDIYKHFNKGICNLCRRRSRHPRHSLVPKNTLTLCEECRPSKRDLFWDTRLERSKTAPRGFSLSSSWGGWRGLYCKHRAWTGRQLWAETCDQHHPQERQPRGAKQLSAAGEGYRTKPQMTCGLSSIGTWEGSLSYKKRSDGKQGEN